MTGSWFGLKVWEAEISSAVFFSCSMKVMPLEMRSLTARGVTWV